MADDFARQLLDALYNPETQPPQQPSRPLREKLAGAAETAATIGTGLLGSVPAGLAGLSQMIPTRGHRPSVNRAAQKVEDVQSALTYLPRGEAGQEYLEKTAGALGVLGMPAEFLGEQTLKLTGSPFLATTANVALDPVNYIGVPGSGKAAVATGKALGRAAAAVPRVAGEMISDLAMPAPRAQAQRGAIDLKSKTPYERSLEQGYEHGWFHGTTGDIRSFDPSRMGEATGAASAKKGFFFVRDPIAPPEEMLKKTSDPKSIELVKGHLQKLGVPDEEIEALNQVSFKGNAAETASGYSSIGGSRTYKEAMKKANEAEKRGDWTEYERQMQIAEDSEMDRLSEAQGLVAKYGDRRDEMTDAIQKAVYDRPLPQKEAEELDKWFKSYMPYGWYNSYSPAQFKGLKKELISKIGEEKAAPAIEAMNEFEKVRAERNLAEKSQEGANVMPVALRYKNPFVYDFKGSSYRDQSYSDLIDQAILGGHDALILRNTYDPGGGPAKLVDIGVVFDPSQIRSTFAKFNPKDIKSTDITKKDGGSVHISDNPDTMQLELQVGGAVKAAKAASKAAAKAAEKEGLSVPFDIPRAPAKSKEEIRPIAERMARQMTGEFVRLDPKESINPAGKSLKRFLQEKEFEKDYITRPTKQVTEPEFADIEKQLGMVKFGIPGDTTIANQELIQAGPYMLDIPSPQHGGPRFPLGGEGAWASNNPQAANVQKRAVEMSEYFNAPVMGQYIAMGPTGSNFAQHFADASLRAIDLSKMSKSQIEQFNELIRKGSEDSGPRPSFPGIQDKDQAYFWLSWDPELRKHFNALMVKPKYTQPFGLPDGRVILDAITEPALRNKEISTSGFSQFDLDPSIRPEDIPLSEHPTYTHLIPMKKGAPVRQTRYPIPAELEFPDVTKFIRERYRPSEFTPTFQKASPRQKIDQQAIDEIKMYEEMMKSLTGKKKGGAVKKQAGGAIKAAVKAAKPTAEQAAKMAEQRAELVLRSRAMQELKDQFENLPQPPKGFLSSESILQRMDEIRRREATPSGEQIPLLKKGGAIEMQVGGALKAAAKAAERAAKAAKPEVLPAAEREANLKKMLKSSHVKRPVYHGTNKTDTLADESGQAIRQFDSYVNWFTQDPYHASGYATQDGRQIEGAATYPAYLSLQRPLHLRGDLNDKTTYAQFRKETGLDVRPGPYEDEVVDGVEQMIPRWWITNSPSFADAARAAGFDGVIANEGGTKTFGIFYHEPGKIKSAIGNRGTFDVTNPDITKKRGGSVKFTDNLDTMRLAVQKRK